jgi:putative transposase
MNQKRAYRYRFYPTDEQIQILAQTFGCVRFVYNWALGLKTTAYQERKERLSYNDLSAKLTQLKKQPDRQWLNEVSSVCLQQTLRHLDSAFKSFFKGITDYPVFKKKSKEQSVTYVGVAFHWNGSTLTLVKMNDPLDIHWSRPLPENSKPSSVTVSKDATGRYFISILVEEDIKPLPVTPKMIGIDLGLTSMVAMSNGEKVGSPKFYRKDEKKLARAQRRLAKKKQGSKNREKARKKVARLHARITDKRRDFQHKLSTSIVRENQVICVETLKVKNMIKNHSLAKSIADVGWGEFVRQLEYKAEWYGRTFIKIDRWEPSSKRCFHCKHVVDELDLKVRSWICPNCHTFLDRDLNAANNILAAGLAVFACGEGVRPIRTQSQSGNRRRSRKAS